MTARDPQGQSPLPEEPAAGLDALLAGHALGDLDSQECEQLMALLERDPALQQRLDQFRTALELLPLGLPDGPQPSPRLRQRLLAGEGAPQPLPWSGTWWGSWSWLALVLALAAGALGLELHQTRLRLAKLESPRRAPSLLAASPAALRQLPLRGLAAAMPASGDVLVTGNDSYNVLMLRDLPAPPPGRVYRLWADVDGRQVGCVAFVPTQQGRVGLLIPAHPTSEARSVSVSLEAEASGSAPQGPVLLRSVI